MERRNDQNTLDSENEQNIRQQLQSSRERASENMIQESVSKQRIKKLIKLLTYKNDKIQNERVEKKVETLGSKKLGLRTQPQIDKYKMDELAAYKAPFSKRNTFAQLDSNRNDSINTLELFQMHDKIKRYANQSTFLLELNEQRQEERERRDDEYEGREKIKVNQLKSLLNQIRISKKNGRDNGKHLKQLKEQMMKGEKADEAMQKASLSRRIDQVITRYFLSQASLKQASLQLKNLTKSQKNLSKQKIFSLFIFQLNQKIELAKKNNMSLSQYVLHQPTQDYQVKYTNCLRNLSLYANIRCKKLTRNMLPIGPDYIFIQKSLTLWCRLLMLLISQKLTETELILDLNNEEYKYFIQSFIDFNKKKTIENKDILQSRCEYETNIYYRIFVKILLCQPFSESESNTLNDQQKQIITFLKLKYHPQFYRTMQFKQVKIKLMNQLGVAIDNEDLQIVYNTLLKLIEISAFDDMYFIVFSADRNRLSSLQLLLLMNVIFQNPVMLECCGGVGQEWVNRCFDMLQQLIRDSDESSAYGNMQVLIKMLTLCKHYVSKKDLELRAIDILSCNKLILRRFIIPSIDYLSIITINWGLDLSMLQVVLSRSINTQEQYQHYISHLISPYIEFNLTEIKEIPSTHKIRTTIHNASRNREITKSQSNLNRIIQSDSSLSLDQLVMNNSSFISGFKLDIKLLLKLLANKTQYYWSDQMNLSLYKQKVIFPATMKLRQVLSKHCNGQPSSKNNSSQHISQTSTSPENQLKIKECKHFIEQISSLLDIYTILITFIQICKFSQNQQPSIIDKVASYIQEFILTGQGLTIKLHNFCQNLAKLNITDRSFGFKFLSNFTGKLLESLIALGFKQDRKMNLQVRGIKTSVILNFVQDSLEIINRFSDLEEQISLKWKKQTHSNLK